MGWKFRKRIKIMPGVSLNLSKSGVSTTIGPRGASVNIGKRGTYLNTGIPGTGLYNRQRIDAGDSNSSGENNVMHIHSGNNTTTSNNNGCGGCLIVFLFLAIMSTIIEHCEGSKDEIKPIVEHNIRLGRERFDSIRNSTGSIESIKFIKVSDVLLTLKKDTLFLETPYNCFRPAIVFNFENPVFSKSSRSEHTEHIYYLSHLNSQDKSIYYIVKDNLPDLSEARTENNCPYNGDLCNFCICYPQKDWFSIKEIKRYSNNIDAIKLKDNCKRKIGKEILDYKQVLSDFCEADRTILYFYFVEDSILQIESVSNSPVVDSLINEEARCQAIVKGNQCLRQVVSGSIYCSRHSIKKTTTTSNRASSFYSSGSGGGQCNAITRKGRRCSRSARSNGYCWQHGG